MFFQRLIVQSLRNVLVILVASVFKMSCNKIVKTRLVNLLCYFYVKAVNNVWKVRISVIEFLAFISSS